VDGLIFLVLSGVSAHRAFANDWVNERKGDFPTTIESARLPKAAVVLDMETEENDRFPRLRRIPAQWTAQCTRSQETRWLW
jgi:hypothetical protein